MRSKLEKKIAALERASMRQLKAIWRTYFDDDPVRFQSDYMARRIAFKMQVEAHGGLKKTLRNQLERMAAAQPKPTKREQARISMGTRLTKLHRGEEIVVDVLADGFEFRGRRYRSLTAIASELMGCRMSGPRFFGMDHGR